MELFRVSWVPRSNTFGIVVQVFSDCMLFDLADSSKHYLQTGENYLTSLTAKENSSVFTSNMDALVVVVGGICLTDNKTAALKFSSYCRAFWKREH